MPTRYCRLSLLLILIAACRPASPRTQPEPAAGETPTLHPPSAEISTRDSWTIQPTSQQHRYRATVVSVIATGDTVSLPTRDSSQLTADFTISAERATRGSSYSVTLEGLSIRWGSGSAASSPLDLPSPISFTGRIESGQFTFNPAADCASQVSSAIPLIQRSLTLVPLQIQKSLVWTDSASATVCSGSIPVTLAAMRSYRVIGETKSGARTGILLERQDRTVSTGEGAEGQHRVQLKSEGTGQTQLLVDPATGALIEATGMNTTVVTVTTSGRSRRFIQTSREHITER